MLLDGQVQRRQGETQARYDIHVVCKNGLLGDAQGLRSRVDQGVNMERVSLFFRRRAPRKNAAKVREAQHGKKSGRGVSIFVGGVYFSETHTLRRRHFCTGVSLFSPT